MSLVPCGRGSLIKRGPSSARTKEHAQCMPCGTGYGARAQLGSCEAVGDAELGQQIESPLCLRRRESLRSASERKLEQTYTQGKIDAVSQCANTSNFLTSRISRTEKTLIVCLFCTCNL